jgi:bilin biosynthesis protein
MDNRFGNLFNLTEDEAIALLDTPLDELGEDDSRYVAVAQLANYPTEKAIDALIRAVKNTDPVLENRIVRRKAVESLGKMKVKRALETIVPCLQEADDDCYLVENTVWAIGEIGTNDEKIFKAITELLTEPGQIYRVIIHTLAKLEYKAAIDSIRRFTKSEDKPTASAAIAAICRLTGDYSAIEEVVEFLYDPNVYARRLCVQDLIDSAHYAAIPKIAKSPISIVFRLRGIRMLSEMGLAQKKLTFAEIKPYLENTILDRPSDIQLIHAYDRLPTLDFLMRELYDTDFGRCYLAVQTILDNYAAEAPAALVATYEEEASNDYGAHYHVMKLFGWLKFADGYDILIQGLHNREPQFQKSRAAAALALAELGDRRAIPELYKCFETKIWDLKYAALMALERFDDFSQHSIAANDADFLVKLRADRSI